MFHDGYVTPAYRQAGSNNENQKSPFFSKDGCLRVARRGFGNIFFRDEARKLSPRFVPAAVGYSGGKVGGIENLISCLGDLRSRSIKGRPNCLRSW